MAIKRIIIIGAGGFAREVNWLLNEINKMSPLYHFLGCVVSDLKKNGEDDAQSNILGDFSWIDKNRSRVDCLAMGIGDPSTKMKLAAELESIAPSIEWPPLVHPSVKYEKESCKIEKGVVICAGVIATVNVTFKEMAMVNLSCTIGHEAYIGRGSVINPSANISGGVHLGERVLVGTGAQILQFLRIGDGAIIGAGSVVTRVVEAGETVIGVPAKPLIRKS